jgi:hypothetical protein
MDTVAPQQTPPKKDKLHRVLIAMVVLLSVFIVGCLALIAFVVIPHRPTQPRPMTLQHPDGETIPAGASREDLEQAIRLTKESGIEMLKQNPDAVTQKVDEMGQLILAGKLVELASGTNCLLLESHGSTCQVQITEGLRNGQAFWVPRQYLTHTYKDGQPTMGFCCMSIYLRYLITAAACCAGLYFLKLKSVILQIILFIIGMFVLNWIWVKIAVLLMF